MHKSLVVLKQELLDKGIDKHWFGVDELPYSEGYCIYDARSLIEVFYYERGQKSQYQTFDSLDEAIKQFKLLVFEEPAVSPNLS
jgi:hypothetical protein